MTKDQKKLVALRIANSFDKIDIECPRYCKNPGLYFGAMLALDMVTRPKEDNINEIIEMRKKQFEELKAKKNV